MGEASYDPASHYDRVTDAWTLLLGHELHYGLFEDPGESLGVATGRLTDRMLDELVTSSGHRVLDVGCGTGAPACRLAATRDVEVVGISTSEVGVAAAAARAEQAGLAHLASFEVRDGMDNGLPDASFDRVLALESSHLMRDRAALVGECARVLRPGGRLALCDIVLARPMPFEEVRRLRRPLALLREVFGDARMEPLERYAGLARDAGLSVIASVDLTAATRPTFARWRENAHAHRDQVVASIGVDDWQRFVDSCDVLEGFWDDGTLGYGLLTAARGVSGNEPGA